MFSSLLSSASTEKQFKALSFILRIWYKEKRQCQSFLETLLVELLDALADGNVKEETILAITREEVELLNETIANDFFEKLYNKGSYFLSFKFALQTSHKNLATSVVENLKSMAEGTIKHGDDEFRIGNAVESNGDE